MTVVNLESVHDAIDPLRSGFQADGADLVVERATEDGVVVRLVVTDETCLDCIVPTDMLHYLVSNAINTQWPDISHIDIVDPREDD